MKKRIWYGKQIVEWSQEEGIARRYDVYDVTQTLRLQKKGKLIEEKPITPEINTLLLDRWIHDGMISVDD